MFRLFLVLFALISIVAKSESESAPSKKCSGDPLILTPLIEKGDIDSAREKSYVKPFLPNIHSYSGFLTVNETNNSNLFFWFFKQSSSEWSTRPVVLWLQGGPGCSSIFGLFTENGPFQVKNSKLVKTKYPWTNYYNVLYIDNPIGAGYSFGQYVHNEKAVGQHLFDALIQFSALFPELRKNKFFISGESYAGKYIPVLGYEIYNRNPTQNYPINLKGLFIGNGLCDLENMIGYSEHLHKLGLIDHRQKLILQKYEEDVRVLIRNSQWSKVADAKDKARGTVRKFTNFTRLYDYLLEDFNGGDSYIEFINDDEFRKNIHVGQVEYDDCSDKVDQLLRDDQGQNVIPQIEKLLEVYPVMFYNGQLDLADAHYLTSNFINKLHWSGAEGYSEAKRKIWYVNNHLAGYYKSYGNLKTALVRNSGHMVPAKHPLFLLDLLNKFVSSKI